MGVTPIYGFPFPNMTDVIDSGDVDDLYTAVRAQTNAVLALRTKALNKDSCQAMQDTAYSMGASGVDTAANLNVQNWDSNAMFAPTSNIITLKAAGLWLFMAYANWTAPATGTVTSTKLSIRVAGTIRVARKQRGKAPWITASVIYPAAINDTVQLLNAWTGSGAAAQTGDVCILTAQLIAPAP